MAEIHWRRAIGHLFSKASAWKGGVVPGASDDALLEATGADYTVTSSRKETVSSIQLAANATLNIAARTFTATAGTGSGANAGTIGIYGTATLAIGGAIDNSGVISLNNAGSSEASATTLMIASNTTLSGGGDIELSDDFFNNIIGNGTTLTNVDNLISGAGLIGSTKKGLTLINDAAGVIDATGSNALDIGPLSGAGGFVVNDGLLEASGSGGLTFGKMTISGSGGTIAADSGSFISFSGCAVTGQSFSIQAGAAIVLNLTTATVTDPVINAGRLEVLGHSGSLTLDGALNSSGILEVNGGVLKVTATVSGDGHALIYAGKLEFDSTFSQNVVFAGSAGAGTLLLGESQSYTGDISGYSTTGASILDLRDIGFVSSGEATFSGTSTSGVLTVTDGTHTANITLEGDYLSTNFVASSDGHNGTIVVASGGAASVPPHRFVEEMAGLGGSAGGAIQLTHTLSAHDLVLARPHVMTA